MSYVITKQPDGDVSLGNLNGELASLSDSPSDYATGGYAIVGGETANKNNTPNLINCDLWRILTVLSDLWVEWVLLRVEPGHSEAPGVQFAQHRSQQRHGSVGDHVWAVDRRQLSPSGQSPEGGLRWPPFVCSEGLCRMMILMIPRGKRS